MNKEANTPYKQIQKTLDKIEYRIRLTLSKYPILYAFLVGVGTVLFWRGVWHLADEVNLGSEISLIAGTVILVATGIFVAEFIGNRLIISGLVGEKKLEEKEVQEIETEEMQIRNLQSTLTRLEKKLDHLDEEIEGKK